ncbi:MAG: serine hydrolase [Bacteroidota bacterium]
MKVFLFLVVYLNTIILAAQELYFPSTTDTTWTTLPYEDLNWCDHEIASLYNYLDVQRTKSFILLKDGKIVLEKYFGEYTQDSLWFWFSAGKSLMSVLVGISQQNNLLSIDDATSDYLGTGWTSLEPEEEVKITIRNQITMTSGIDETTFTCTVPACLTYRADVGTRWVYHNGPYSLLRNVLENAHDDEINNITASSIATAIGMQGFWVRSGFNNFFISRARDMARFGLLIQAGGTWDENAVLSDQDYYDAMINPSQNLNPSYGYLWWLNGQSSYIPPGGLAQIPGAVAPDAPSDLITAAGSQGQFISISKSTGLVLIRQGQRDDNDLAPLNFLNEIWKRVLNLECQVTSIEHKIKQPVIPSPVGDYLKIQSNVIGLAIYDLYGRTLLVEQKTDGLDIDVSTLTPGMYILKGTIDGELFKTRLYKE